MQCLDSFFLGELCRWPLGVLSSDFAGDEAVDEVARGHDEDSEYGIEVGHEASGRQSVSHHMNVLGSFRIEDQMPHQ